MSTDRKLPTRKPGEKLTDFEDRMREALGSKPHVPGRVSSFTMRGSKKHTQRSFGESVGPRGDRPCIERDRRGEQIVWRATKRSPSQARSSNRRRNRRARAARRASR